MVAFFVPPPPIRVGSAYACTLTAATLIFATGYISGGTGSISQEPIAGQTLRQFVSSLGTTNIKFEGNIAALLSGLTVYVDSVSYASGFSGWSYDGGDGATVGTWASGGPIFVASSVYAVEIK